MLAINDYEVAEVVEGRELTCVTEHPGFKSVCLNKWGVRLSADKYRRKNGTRYRQTQSENQ